MGWFSRRRSGGGAGIEHTDGGSPLHTRVTRGGALTKDLFTLAPLPPPSYIIGYVPCASSFVSPSSYNIRALPPV